MKVCDYSFRDLDKRWVGIEKKKFVKKIGKKLRLKYLQRPVFGCFYIDKDYGLSLRIVGNIEKDGRNKLYLDNDLVFDSDLVLDYDVVKKFEIELIDKDTIEMVEGSFVLENKLDIHYKDVNHFLDTREMVDLDPFRNEQFPDDIQVLLKNKGDNPDELLWARIEGVMDVKPDVLICKLQDSSSYNEEYVTDTMVGVKYFKDEDSLKIVGMLRRREK